MVVNAGHSGRGPPILSWVGRENVRSCLRAETRVPQGPACEPQPEQVGETIGLLVLQE